MPLLKTKRAVRDVPSLVRQGLFRYYIRKQSLFIFYWIHSKVEKAPDQEDEMSKLQELQNRIGYTFEKEGLIASGTDAQFYANEKHMKNILTMRDWSF